MTAPLRLLLKLVGKGERKVVAVFAPTAESAHTAVLYVRQGAPETPVWLFSTAEPLAQTASLCECVHVDPSAMALLLGAQRRLWPHWVAMAVAVWTGDHGKWPLKLAPFLIPPFRALLLNEHGGFFAGRPGGILNHLGRRWRDAFDSGWHRTLDLGRGYWLLVSYHIWRSGPVRRVKDEVAGVFLLMASVSLRSAAAVLRWCCFPQQAWFERIHGSEALNVAAEVGAGREIVRLRQKAASWDGTKVAGLAAISARFVVFQDSAEDAPIDDMLALFDDERTFAVSRQVDFRAWRSMLFPMAPFRTMQPGEASQVLGPISGTMVVDRRKLLALGIPHCGLAGTAWMILFWKAAAAGWRSYSGGQGSRLREQPDYPMQETGFLLRILWSKGLRRLGPREPDLARGSIAFSVRPRPVRRDRLTVLIVSPFLPYPLSHGGAVRMFNLCGALSGRVDFVLIAIREAQDAVNYDKLHEVFREVYVVDKDERASGGERLPEQVRQHQLRSVRALAAELARTWKPDLLQVEYTHMAGVRDAVPGTPAVLVEHDLTFSLYRQLAEKEDAGSPRGQAAHREYQRWLEFERHWLGAYDGVWAVSEDDRLAAMREGNRSGDATFAVPNGVDIERFVPCEEPTAAPEVFYVGSFRHLPNVLGFQKLREEVMPRVWERFPETRLRVVAGPQHELFWRKYAPQTALRDLDSRIAIDGFIEDLRPLYARASVVVAPLEVSAGTNIKVLEAMACGKALVTTPIGCAGLGLEDRADAWIDSDWAAFAQSVTDLLGDDELRRRAGARARRTVEERFSWTAIADAAWNSYQTLAKSVYSTLPG